MSDSKDSSILTPGKTIEFISGEILSIKLSQWGVIGQLRTEIGVYDYKLKEPEMAKRILVGMDLTITNGFCVKNKKNDIIITDGKFGTIDIGINIASYYKKSDREKAIITGNVKSFKVIDNEIFLELHSYYPPEENKRILISLPKNEEDKVLIKKLEGTLSKIIRLEGTKIQGKYSIDSFEILPNDHLWYKFEELIQGNIENMVFFSLMISKQKTAIENYFESFRELLFSVGKDVSKSTLTTLRTILDSKIFAGKLSFPYNLLISDKEIVNYLKKMAEFCRNFVYSSNIVNNPEDLLNLIRNYFPVFNIN